MRCNERQKEVYAPVFVDGNEIVGPPCDVDQDKPAIRIETDETIYPERVDALQPLGLTEFRGLSGHFGEGKLSFQPKVAIEQPAFPF